MVRGVFLSAGLAAGLPAAGLSAKIPESGIINVGGTCYLASDIVILQDTTGSFMDDMPVVHAQIPDLMEKVAQTFPGTLFGIAEFRDKPFYPIGELDDFCYKLRYGELTNKADLLQFAWDILQPSGGGDWYESQYQAGIDVVLDPNIGWRPLIEGAYNVTLGKAGEPELLKAAVKQWEGGAVEFAGARVVILITDAEPHEPGDMSMCKPGALGWEPSWDCPQNLPPNPGTIVDDDPMNACTNYDFASEDQFVKAALQQNVVFMFLTTADVAPFYRNLVVNRFGSPEAFSQVITENSSNMAAALIDALKALSEVACEEESTTTTEAPSEPSSITAPVTTAGPQETTTQAAPATTAPPVETTEAPAPPPTTTPAAPLTTAAPVETTTTAAPPPRTTSQTPPDECKPCPPCTKPDCPPCPCHPSCGNGCDDLVIKIGPSIKKLQLKYEN